MAAQWKARHTAAVAALLTCSSVTEAAAWVGVNPSTLRGWVRQPWFRDQLQQAHAASPDAAAGFTTARALRRGPGRQPGHVKPPEQLARRTLLVRFDDDLDRQLREYAAATYRSMNGIIRQALTEFLDHHRDQ